MDGLRASFGTQRRPSPLWRAAGSVALALATATLLACGGSGSDSGGGKSAPTYAVGGTLAGLGAGTVVLSSGVDSVEITVGDGVVRDRPFQIATLPTGAAYNVLVDQQPAGVSCSVLNGAASVGTAPVSDIQVLCVRIKSLAFVAGIPPAYGAQDGVGILAGFSRVSGMATDAAGNLYVNDANAVRKVTPSGIVTTLAGRSLVPGYVDGAGAEARFGDNPGGIAVDPQGNVYVSDTANKALRRISPAGIVSTELTEDRYALGALTVDASGNLLLIAGGRAVVKITPAGQQTVLAGDLDFSTSGDLNQQAPTGFLGGNFATQIAVDPAGNVYISGSRSPQLTVAWSLDKITPSGKVSRLVVGRPLSRFGCNPPLPPESIEGTAGIAAGAGGEVWVSQSIEPCNEPGFPNGARRLLKIDAAGTVQTVADLDLNFPALGPLVSNAAGTLHFSTATSIFQWTQAGGATSFAGAGGGVFVDGPAASARFSQIKGLSVRNDGALFVSDVGFNHAVRQISPTGHVTTPYRPEFSGFGNDFPFTLPSALDATQAAYVRFNCGLVRIAPDGTVSKLFDVDPTATSVCADIDGPAGTGKILGHTDGRDGIVADRVGGVLVWNPTCLRRVGLDGSVATLAGDCLQAGQVDATRSAARFTSIRAVAPLTGGAFLVLDATALRRVTDNGIVETLQTVTQNVFAMAGDGRGNVGVVLDDGVYWFSNAAFDRRTKVIDYGPRTVLGPLPTSVESRPGAIAIGNGKLFIAVNTTVFAVDL